MTPPFKPLIWIVASSFVLLQFFLQLSSGVIIDMIRHDMQLTALSAGLLSGSFYIVYTLLQIPAGMLCDRNNPRPILAFSALLCSLGCVVFAASYSLSHLYVGRVLIALGSAFGFVCLTHLIREHYPKHLFSLLISISETASFLLVVFGIIGLGTVISYWGWRGFINGGALIACLIAYLCWRHIPDKKIPTNTNTPNVESLAQVLTSLPLWFNGLFIGLTFMIVTVFGALWAPPFFQVKLHCSLHEASLIDALLILGVALSCPLFGVLDQKIKSRKRLIITGCLATAAMLIVIIFLPCPSTGLMAFMVFVLGLVSGSYILGYTIANELSPPNSLSTTTGLTNTLALVMTPILQPFIGYRLDSLHTAGLVMIKDFQHALMVLPLCLLIAAVLVFFLPNINASKHPKHASQVNSDNLM